MTSSGAGCGRLGVDSAYSHVADSQKEWSWYSVDNADLMGASTRLALANYKQTLNENNNFAVNLVNR